MGDSDDDQNNLKNRDKFQSERDDFDSNQREQTQKKTSQDDSFDRWRQNNNSMSNKQGGRPNNYRNQRFGGESRGYGNGPRGGQGYNNNRDSRNIFNMKKFHENNYKQLMSFKQFVQYQDDTITCDDSVQKYREYLKEFNKHQVHLFLEIHQNNEWMLNIYHPYFETLQKIRQIRLCRRRLHAFNNLSSIGILDTVVLDSSCNAVSLLIDVVNCLLNNIPFSEVEELIQKQNSVKDVKDDKEDPALMFDDVNTSISKKRKHNDEDEEEVWDTNIDHDIGDHSIFKNYRNVSIVLTNVPCSIKRAEMIKAYKDIEGFVRICIMPPDPDAAFTRKVYITFKPSVDIDETWEAVKDAKLNDSHISSYVDYNVAPIVRAIRGYWCTRKVVLEHLKFASKLIEKFDEEMFLYTKALPTLPDFNPAARSSNKTTSSTTESTSSTDCSDDDDTAGESFEIPPKNPYMEKVLLTIDHLSDLCLTEESSLEEVNLETLAVLDNLIIYLRVVHACDFYSFTRNLCEFDLPSRCPNICVRKVQIYTDIKMEKIDKFMEESKVKRDRLLILGRELLTDEELLSLGPKNETTEINNFIEKNTVELHPDVWLCPLSEKKFKAKEYVQKHIYNKFIHLIDNIKMDVIYHNNYLSDKNRIIYFDKTMHETVDETNNGKNNSINVSGYKSNSNYSNNSSINNSYTGGNKKRPLIRYVDWDAPEVDVATYF